MFNEPKSLCNLQIAGNFNWNRYAEYCNNNYANEEFKNLNYIIDSYFIEVNVLF